MRQETRPQPPTPAKPKVKLNSETKQDVKNRLQDLSRHISKKQDRYWKEEEHTLQVFQSSDPIGRRQQTQQAHHTVSEVLSECLPVSKEKKKCLNRGKED